MPSGKKSWSPKKSRAFHGLCTGSSIVSTTYGHEPARPRLPFVVKTCGHCAGPPRVDARQRMLVDRSDDPRELAIFDPGGIEQLDVADSIGEDNALAVPVKAVIDKRLVGPWHPAGLGRGVPSMIRPSIRPWRVAENLTNPPLQTAS